ncbi:N-acetyltransferase GCN5 [Basidiobolus meristosporus CBS 931.73]|uniref:N-acetyltransferase GCN5 n=1 Tax=Basidiobolus meristosporus CBS 931.73 TaxID=1314790 RepID=A0A1Y1VTF6_9FUNG|nr:N-acetyltransferase GCN5 [Basidiobolus meristosporus CBS 931.73]|eukprot:ORX64581.1 N-acetyltransferase GCN5 [Basidiobolus meristosporus CBS 931.73]
MLRVERTDSNGKGFKQLIAALDEYLAIADGHLSEEERNAYVELNTIEYIDTVVMAYDDEEPVGCVCFRPYDAQKAELKRMFVAPEKRKLGVASAQLNFKEIILETGQNMQAAINFYTKQGYEPTDRYGVYVNAPNSVCMKKRLNKERNR